MFNFEELNQKHKVKVKCQLAACVSIKRDLLSLLFLSETSEPQLFNKIVKDFQALHGHFKTLSVFCYVWNMFEF